MPAALRRASTAMPNRTPIDHILRYLLLIRLVVIGGVTLAVAVAWAVRRVVRQGAARRARDEG